MKIIEKVKEFFRRINIKKLKSPEVSKNRLQTLEKNKTGNLNYLREKQANDYTEEQKLEIMFKTIGCEQVSIKEILKTKNIDINNLRKNIQTLSKLKCSNIELSIIITYNTKVLTMQNDKLNEIINTFMEYYNNVAIVKELIYANSRILDEKILNKFVKVKEMLFDYGISIIDDYNILIENINVLFIDETRLKESLDIIKLYTETIEKMKSLIIMEPLVIGVTNTNILSKYV